MKIIELLRSIQALLPAGLAIQAMPIVIGCRFGYPASSYILHDSKNIFNVFEELFCSLKTLVIELCAVIRRVIYSLFVKKNRDCPNSFYFVMNGTVPFFQTEKTREAVNKGSESNKNILESMKVEFTKKYFIRNYFTAKYFVEKYFTEKYCETVINRENFSKSPKHISAVK